MISIYMLSLMQGLRWAAREFRRVRVKVLFVRLPAKQRTTNIPRMQYAEACAPLNPYMTPIHRIEGRSA
jgi:hypothetical protein